MDIPAAVRVILRMGLRLGGLRLGIVLIPGACVAEHPLEPADTSRPHAALLIGVRASGPAVAPAAQANIVCAGAW